MTPEQSVHLSEDALYDVLIDLGSEESNAHLARCGECRDKVNEFRSDMQMFNATSLKWSEAKAATTLRVVSEPSRRRALPIALGWALAATVLLAASVPLWNHFHHGSLPQRAATAAWPGDSDAQIAQDNELLRSVDVALNDNEASQISEYHLADGPQPHRRGRLELRNR